MDKTAPRFDGYYVRVESTANRRSLLVGVVQGGKPAMLSRYAIWTVPPDMVDTAYDLATVVDTFAREQHVHNLCDVSDGLLYRFKLQAGDKIYGEGHAPSRSRTADAKQARGVKVCVGRKNGDATTEPQSDAEE